MKGKLIYQKKSDELINSVEGWFIVSEDSSKNFEASKETLEKIKSGKYDVKDGDEVEYVLKTNCQVMYDDIFHSTIADIIITQKMVSRVFLIDIDGTICDDIKNEDSHLYKDAKPYEGSKEQINKLAEEGNTIVFFTAREYKDKGVTLSWLWKHGFKFHDLITDKPRCSEDEEYVWIDNKPVRGITYKGEWGPIVETKNQEVKTLLNFNIEK